MVATVWSRTLTGTDHVDVDGRIILKWVSENYSVRVWIGLNYLRIGPVVEF
jgi:hypothetical protein